jgi:flagellin-like protein
MKGITPIISVIILLLITIGLASAAWTYMSGYMNSLTSRVLEISPASCIGGTQVTFLVRNAGTNNIGGDSIKAMNLNSGAAEALTWQYLNGTDVTSPIIESGSTIRAKITNPCTTAGVAKTCEYELTLIGSTWKQEIPVACTG